MPALTLDAKIEEIVERDSRFSPEAYHFVFEALDFVSERPELRRRRSLSRHVTVTQLLEGLRDLALEQFGPLARCVLESWGVYSTEDFGEIVFRMVDHDLLNRSESDQRQDFRAAFSFREVFDEGYSPNIRWGDESSTKLA
jgi:uncharacterized repeat protein (TIGR04138 family)